MAEFNKRVREHNGSWKPDRGDVGAQRQTGNALAQRVAVLSTDDHIVDARIAAHLLIGSPEAPSGNYPTVIEVSRDGKEKVTTSLPAGDNVFVADGTFAHMKMGSKSFFLSPAAAEDFQITVLPQWSSIRRHADKDYQANAYGEAKGMSLVEIMPPVRKQPGVENVIPATPTCFALEPQTLRVMRMERVLRPENQLTRVHRESTVYSNYKVINGIAVPMTQETYIDGQLRHTLVIDDVKFNVEFSASEFSWK